MYTALVGVLVISETRLFYRLSLVCSLASEDIKQNEMNEGVFASELRSCVKVEVAVPNKHYCFSVDVKQHE